MSTLPVRSPLPKSVPSTRSAPARSASSVAAIPVPRSLWVCSETMVEPRRRQVVAHPLDLVGVDVGRRILDGRREVEDDLVRRGRGPRHRVTASQISSANSSSVLVKLSGEYSRRRWVPAAISGAAVALELLDRADGDLHDLLPRQVEDVLALPGGGGVVEVEDDVLRALDGFERARDQVLPALAEHLDRDVVRDAASPRSGAA